ncbi:MAG: cytochrome P450 [Proteobacteria bacterium]|nr:cytochrome P450 [Pseudomonadota bacterium]
MSVPEATVGTVPGPDEPFDLGASEESLERLTGWCARYGEFFRVYSPARRRHTYVVLAPDDIKRVLVTNHRNYVKGVGTDQIMILLGRGIMTSEGDFWHRQRRMLQPAFHRRVLDRFGPAIRAVNAEYAARWAKRAQRGEPINITEAASELTLDINLSAIFGRDLPFIRERFGRNPFDIVHTEANRDLRFAYRIRSLAGIVRELIARRRADPSQEHFDFFGLALGARDKDTGAVMTEKELVDEVLTLVVAGHETTASALTWTWYQLGRHPQFQEWVAASAARLPDGDGLDLERTEEWHEGQQVIKESLRLCPPGWMMTRRTLEPDVLHGVTLPRGADVFVSPYFVHRHPGHWSDAERFEPARFAEAPSAARHRFAYIPFGAGPRHCIGENFALYEIAVHFATMARRFRLLPIDDAPPQVEARINYRLRSDLMMRIEPR